MFSKKNIIVIAIMAVMLMGSVVLSAYTYDIYVNANYTGIGIVKIENTGGQIAASRYVAYEVGINHIQFELPEGLGRSYMAIAEGCNLLPGPLYKYDSDFEFVGPGGDTVYLRLDLAPGLTADPDQPINK